MPILHAIFLARRWMRALLTLAVLCDASAAAASWPVVELPPDSERFAVGDRLVLDGVPMRVEGFESRSTPEPLIAWLRARLGPPLVENDFGGAKILGRVQGDHYVMVRVEAATRGSRGIVALSDLRAAYDNRKETEAAAGAVLARMPSGSKLLSRQISVDGGRISRHLVVLNSHDETLNRTRIEAMLRDEGLSLELASDVRSTRGPRKGAGHALFFRGPGREAAATIFRDERGHTVAILNIVSEVERMP